MTARRERFPPPPADEGALLDLPVHRVVMEWPETLALLRERGVRVGVEGGRAVAELDDAAALAGALHAVTAWRSR